MLHVLERRPHWTLRESLRPRRAAFVLLVDSAHLGDEVASHLRERLRESEEVFSSKKETALRATIPRQRQRFRQIALCGQRRVAHGFFRSDGRQTRGERDP